MPTVNILSALPVQPQMIHVHVSPGCIADGYITSSITWRLYLSCGLRHHTLGTAHGITNVASTHTTAIYWTQRQFPEAKNPGVFPQTADSQAYEFS